jgi:hypothetical protein
MIDGWTDPGAECLNQFGEEHPYDTATEGTLSDIGLAKITYICGIQNATRSIEIRQRFKMVGPEHWYVSNSKARSQFTDPMGTCIDDDGGQVEATSDHDSQFEIGFETEDSWLITYFCRRRWPSSLPNPQRRLTITAGHSLQSGNPLYWLQKPSVDAPPPGRCFADVSPQCRCSGRALNDILSTGGPHCESMLGSLWSTPYCFTDPGVCPDGIKSESLKTQEVSSTACLMQPEKACHPVVINPDEYRRSYTNVINDDAMFAQSMLDSKLAWVSNHSLMNRALGNWMTMDLSVVQRIQGVVMQARRDHPQWVTTFKVEFSRDRKTWIRVMDKTNNSGVHGAQGTFSWSAKEKIFDGPSRWAEDDTYASRTEAKFPYVVHARYIKVIPLTFEGDIAMRVAVLACKAARESEVPLKRPNAHYVRMFPYCSGHYENIPTAEECQVAANLVTQDTDFSEGVQRKTYPRYCVGAGYKWLEGFSAFGQGFEKEQVALDRDNHAFFNGDAGQTLWKPPTTSLDTRVIDGKLSSICRRKASDYLFTHYGYCATNHLRDYTAVFSLEECAWQCRANSECGYFSYADMYEGQLQLGSCLLYPQGMQCHEDVFATANPYKSYRLIDNCVPTFSDLEGKLVAEAVIDGSSTAELDHACCAACHANRQCVFWVREDGSSGSKTCQLKRGMTGPYFTSKSRGNFKKPPLQANKIAKWSGNWRSEGDRLRLMAGVQNTAL